MFVDLGKEVYTRETVKFASKDADRNTQNQITLSQK